MDLRWFLSHPTVMAIWVSWYRPKKSPASLPTLFSILCVKFFDSSVKYLEQYSSPYIYYKKNKSKTLDIEITTSWNFIEKSSEIIGSRIMQCKNVLEVEVRYWQLCSVRPLMLCSSIKMNLQANCKKVEADYTLFLWYSFISVQVLDFKMIFVFS